MWGTLRALAAVACVSLSCGCSSSSSNHVTEEADADSAVSSPDSSAESSDGGTASPDSGAEPSDGGTASLDSGAPAAEGGTNGGNLDHFTGTPFWGGTLTTITTCGTAAPATTTDTYAAKFTPMGTSAFTYTSNAGCMFEFTVSGNNATLSNAPVTCNDSAADGATTQFSYTRYMLATSDGHNLTGSAMGTSVSGGPSCTFTETITASR